MWSLNEEEAGHGNHGPASLLFPIHLEPRSGFVSKLTRMVDVTNERKHGELKTLYSLILDNVLNFQFLESVLLLTSQ